MSKFGIIFSISLLFFCPRLFGQDADTQEFLRGITAYTEGEYSQAYDIFSELYVQASQDDAVAYYLGLSEFALYKIDSATVHLNKAASLDTTNVWYLEALASLYGRVGDSRSFSYTCEKLIKLAPNQYRNPYTLTVVADDFMNSFQLTKAMEYYDMALEIDPEYAPAQLGKLESLRFQGDFPQLFVTLEDFIRNEFMLSELKSEYVESILANMDESFYQSWSEQLNKLVDLGLKMDPEDERTVLNKIRMTLMESKADSVVFYSVKLAELAEKKGHEGTLLMALSIAGDVSYELNDSKAAFNFYEQALKVDPDCTSVLNNYAYYLCEEGSSLKKALKMSRRAVDLEPDNATYLDTYGWALYLLGKVKAAKPVFKHAMIYGGKESSVILEHYAKVLEKLGEKELSAYYSSLAEQKKLEEQ